MTSARISVPPSVNMTRRHLIYRRKAESRYIAEYSAFDLMEST